MIRPTSGLLLVLATGGCLGCRCDRPEPVIERTPALASATTAVAQASSMTEGTDAASDPWPELKWYHWVADSPRSMPAPVDTILRRFANSLPGYSVFGGNAESFSEWLRLLPLAAPGTPVKNHRDEIVVPGDDEHLAAVVAIDVGDGEVQQSADVVVRLHAEWRWFVQDLRMLYLSDSSYELPLQKWQRGERVFTEKHQPKWGPKEPPEATPSHAEFRKYLNGVFTWSDRRALLAESVEVAPAGVEPGDFFLGEDNPTDVLLVLDVATSRKGERAMMLARARNPAESIHVLRPSRDAVWFPVAEKLPVRVARSRPFQWKALRRMKPLRSMPEVACLGSMCPPPTPPANTPPR